jgi:hypothetical protein
MYIFSRRDNCKYRFGGIFYQGDMQMIRFHRDDDERRASDTIAITAERVEYVVKRAIDCALVLSRASFPLWLNYYFMRREDLTTDLLFDYGTSSVEFPDEEPKYFMLTRWKDETTQYSFSSFDSELDMAQAIEDHDQGYIFDLVVGERTVLQTEALIESLERLRQDDEEDDEDDLEEYTPETDAEVQKIVKALEDDFDLDAIDYLRKHLRVACFVCRTFDQAQSGSFKCAMAGSCPGCDLSLNDKNFILQGG